LKWSVFGWRWANGRRYESAAFTQTRPHFKKLMIISKNAPIDGGQLCKGNEW